MLFYYIYGVVLLKKELTVTVIALFLGIGIIPGAIGNNSSFGTTIYVDDDNNNGPWDGSIDHPYQFIQDGIDAAVNEDTIFVYSGVYPEEISIDKSITLEGEDRKSVSINKSVSGNAVISIIGNGVTVKEFTIINPKEPGENIGIGIYSNNNHVSGNIIRKARTGILLRDARNNIINENDFLRTATTGVGISIENSYRNEIINNKLSGFFHCIKIIDCDAGFSNTISGNIIDCQNARYAINIYDNSKNFEISYNLITNISSSKGAAIDVNSGVHNIHHNVIQNCPTGIDIDYGGSARVHHNTFLSVENCVKFSLLFKHILSNRYYKNYWNEPKILCHPVQGNVIIYLIPNSYYGFAFDIVKYDFLPAKKPYDIP